MAQSFRTRWQLPLEHGAWGMLYIPLVLGFLRAGIWTWRIPELFLAATGCFLARRPLLAWARAIHWKKPAGDAPRLSLIYLAVGGLSGAVLIVPAGLWGLAALAVIAAVILGVNSWQGVTREDRTFIGELTAIAGMTLTGPAALYAATGRLEFGALLLWSECLLYFLSAVVYVKLRVSATHERHPGDTTRLRLACAGYHVFVVACLAVLVSQKLMTPLGALGY
ncbi:MAG TPA: YwiC-like family protein, partial [Bryobacteraceae bacterium]|nr:YwiC-like family protein [Bryobacteraceae bacterium]